MPPLETGDFLPELDPNNPLGSDAVSLGDDHMRLIKRAVTGSFPAFVGTTATPKSVTLTEDQINDAALKSDAAGNRFVGPIFVEDPSAYWSHDGTADRHIGSASAGVVSLASNVAETTINANEFITGRMQGSDHCRLTTSLNGGFQMQDRARLGYLKAGFRNPRRFTTNASQDVIQDHEGAFVALNTGSTTLTFVQLESLTRITVLNPSGTGTAGQGAGMTLSQFTGANVVDGSFSMPAGTVWDFYQITATIWYAWKII